MTRSAPPCGRRGRADVHWPGVGQRRGDQLADEFPRAAQQRPTGRIGAGRPSADAVRPTTPATDQTLPQEAA